MWLRASALGAIMALLAIIALHWPLENEALTGLALFLALTACVYPGALLAQEANSRTVLCEVCFSMAIFACAWVGLAIYPLLIAFGYAGHGLWDWLHHTEHVATKTSRWFPPACAAFDFIIAAYVILLVFWV